MSGFPHWVSTLLSPAGRRGRLAILAYHQVPGAPDPLRPDVPWEQVFTEQMTWLAEFCHVLPLPEAAQRLADGSLPARAACITFDDGYRDNVTIAAPILRQLDLPASFFITVAAIDRGIMWNDLVIESLRSVEGKLELNELGLGNARIDDEAGRRRAAKDIIQHLKYRPLAQRLDIADSLYARLSDQEPPRLMMTAGEVQELAAMGFDVGAHTVNHPILKEIPLADARREIVDSRSWVTRVTGREPRSFAYPNGRPGTDFDAEHERLVRDAGFEVAVSTRWACAKRGDSRFALPRFTPWERHKGKFWLRLAKTTAQSYIGT